MMTSFLSHSEYISKYDTIDSDENDTLTFTLKKTWIFKPKLSGGLSGDEIVTTLHPGICYTVMCFDLKSNEYFG